MEKEEDKLFQLIPTAMDVWRNGILDMRFNSLLARFREISGKGQYDEEREIQSKLAGMIKLRSEIAKSIGDRIICPAPSIKSKHLPR